MDSVASHLIKNLQCSFCISETNAKVNQTIVEYFVWFVSKIVRLTVHFTNDKKSSHHSSVGVTTNVLSILIKIVSAWLNSLDQTRKCVVVWLDSFVSHLCKYTPSVIYSATSNTNFNKRVVSDLIRDDLLLNHKIKKVERFAEKFLKRTSFQQSVESDLVRLSQTHLFLLQD